MNRRQFLIQAASGVGTLAIAGCKSQEFSGAKKPWFQISLAEWSFHKALFGKKMTHLDFPIRAKREFGIQGIELVNQFFMDKAQDRPYLQDFKSRADTEGVKILLIMCDDEGSLGAPDTAKRRLAVQNHRKWAETAKFFGCHSIRVNAETEGVGSFEEQQKRAADGLHELAGYCGTLGLNCLVENHGHLSSNGSWLAGVMRLVNRSNIGTLPDFGNFDLGNGQTYDRYRGVEEMMPYAKAVSAKSYDFDRVGNCIETDYDRMVTIVRKAGYNRWLGIEYEGEKMSEPQGILATKLLLQRLQT